jgi:hypothetical protein
MYLFTLDKGEIMKERVNVELPSLARTFYVVESVFTVIAKVEDNITEVSLVITVIALVEDGNMSEFPSAKRAGVFPLFPILDTLVAENMRAASQNSDL